MRTIADLYLVMAGLVPVIYVFLVSLSKKQDVDARHKAGHDVCVSAGRPVAHD
jgi:hypothetical protein